MRDELIGCSVRGARSPIGRYLRAATRTPQTVIIVCDNTHDGISLHALLQKEAVEEIGGSAWIGRHKDETRAELSIALYATRRYLELARKTNPRAPRIQRSANFIRTDQPPKYRPLINLRMLQPNLQPPHGLA